MEREEIQKVLQLRDINLEIFSNLPLHVLERMSEDSSEVSEMLEIDFFWKFWVQRNIAPRHTDAFIESIPGAMKWRYYARIYGPWEMSEIYHAIEEGDNSRFYPYLSASAITQVVDTYTDPLFVIDGRLALSQKGRAIYAAEQPPQSISQVFYTLDDRTRVFIVTSAGHLYIQRIEEGSLLRHDMEEDLSTKSEEWLRKFALEAGYFSSGEKEELLRVAEAARSNLLHFGRLERVEIPESLKIVRICNRDPPHGLFGDVTFLMESGDLYSLEHLAFELRKVGEKCIFVGTDGARVKIGSSPEVCLLVETHREQVRIGTASDECKTRPIAAASENIWTILTADWGSASSGNLFFITTLKIEHNHHELPVNIIVAPGSLMHMHDASPALAFAVRGATSAVVWGVDGSLHTRLSVSGGGNSDRKFQYGRSPPYKKYKQAIGVPDFVVTSPERVHNLLVGAVAVERSRLLSDALAQLSDGDILHLAKTLFYASSICDRGPTYLRDVLGREEERRTLALISLLPKITTGLRGLPLDRLVLKDIAFRRKIGRRVLKTDTQLLYALALDKAYNEKNKTPVVQREKPPERLHSMTVAELRAEATGLQIKGRAKMKKQELQEAITKALQK